jgi:hypothetical protein
LPSSLGAARDPTSHMDNHATDVELHGCPPNCSPGDQFCIPVSGPARCGPGAVCAPQIAPHHCAPGNCDVPHSVAIPTRIRAIR